MDPKKFQKKKEDFICENCATAVPGDGYTNHCPQCLWSKHVDVNPGDRQSDCGGLMKPESFEMKDGEYVIAYRCLRCGHERKNKAAKNDESEALAEIAGKS